MGKFSDYLNKILNEDKKVNLPKHIKKIIDEMDPIDDGDVGDWIRDEFDHSIADKYDSEIYEYMKEKGKLIDNGD
jgi:hypothetical protein